VSVHKWGFFRVHQVMGEFREDCVRSNFAFRL